MPLGVILPAAQLVLHGFGAFLAHMLGKRRSEYRPVALFLSLTLAADLIRWAIKLTILWPERTALGPDVPYSGLARISFFVESALFLGWSAGIAALGIVIFLKRRFWLAVLVAVYCIVEGTIAIGYPAIRGPFLGVVYTAVHVAGALVACACAAVWTARRLNRRPEHIATIMIALIDVALLGGAYVPRKHDPFSRWALAQVGYIALFAALCLIQWGALWRGWLISER